MALTLEEKNEKARESIMGELREKYKGKINAENNKLNKEQKFAESLDGENPALKLVEEHKEAMAQRDMVQVRIDRKTVIYVERSKCEQTEDGKWIKKQS